MIDKRQSYELVLFQIFKYLIDRFMSGDELTEWETETLEKIKKVMPNLTQVYLDRKGESKMIGRTGIEKWLNHHFESSSSMTHEFLTFSREYKKELIKQLPSDCGIVNWSRGHFEFSCFIRNSNTGKFIYLSISDVRHFPNEWYENILIRTVKNESDYTGGRNCWSDWKNLRQNIEKLFTF